MRFIIDTESEFNLCLEVHLFDDCIKLSIIDDYGIKEIYLDKDMIYKLNGILHHVQKQLKK